MLSIHNLIFGDFLSPSLPSSRATTFPAADPRPTRSRETAARLRRRRNDANKGNERIAWAAGVRPPVTVRASEASDVPGQHCVATGHAGIPRRHRGPPGRRRRDAVQGLGGAPQGQGHLGHREAGPDDVPASPRGRPAGGGGAGSAAPERRREDDGDADDGHADSRHHAALPQARQRTPPLQEAAHLQERRGPVGAPRGKAPDHPAVQVSRRSASGSRRAFQDGDGALALPPVLRRLGVPTGGIAFTFPSEPHLRKFRSRHLFLPLEQEKASRRSGRQPEEEDEDKDEEDPSLFWPELAKIGCNLGKMILRSDGVPGRTVVLPDGGPPAGSAATRLRSMFYDQ
ncbi:uncharacterized protein LOC144195677 isoform X3 [Stigmatopora nigra]